MGDWIKCIFSYDLEKHNSENLYFYLYIQKSLEGIRETKEGSYGGY